MRICKYFAAVFMALALAACSLLAIINAGVPNDTYRATTAISYGSTARARLEVYQPVDPNNSSPVVVFFYGGNWDSGDRRDYRFVGEALASKGIVAVLPDYRLYPEVRYPDFLSDCAQAVRWTIDHIGKYGGDARRLILMGHSAGAYNAAMLALNAQYLRDAGVDSERIAGFVGLAGPYDFLPPRGAITRAVFGYPDIPVTTQPIHFASIGAPRGLILSGARDDVVDPGNSRRLVARLRHAGAPVHEIEYPALDHHTLVGALAAPLRSRYGPVLEDIARFVNETPVVR